MIGTTSLVLHMIPLLHDALQVFERQPLFKEKLCRFLQAVQGETRLVIELREAEG